MITEELHYEENNDRLIIHRAQDVEPIINVNKDKANWSPTTWGHDMHHVASIPLIVIEQYKKKGIDLLKDKAELRKFLNNSDNKFFRTKLGVV